MTSEFTNFVIGQWVWDGALAETPYEFILDDNSEQDIQRSIKEAPRWEAAGTLMAISDDAAGHERIL